MDHPPDPARQFRHENNRLRHERNTECEERARLQRIVGYLDSERAQERDLAAQHFNTIAGLRHRCAFLQGMREDFGRQRQELQRELGKMKEQQRKLSDKYTARVEELQRERRLSREYGDRLRGREERRAGRGLRTQLEDAQAEIARLNQELRNEKRVSSYLRERRDRERTAAETFHEQVLRACFVYGNGMGTRARRLAIEAGDPQAEEGLWASDERDHGPSSGEEDHRSSSNDEWHFPTGNGGAFIPPSDSTEDSEDLNDDDSFPYPTNDPHFASPFPASSPPFPTWAPPFSASAPFTTTDDERIKTPVPNFAAFNADGQYVEPPFPVFEVFTASHSHAEPPLPESAAFNADNEHLAPPQESQPVPDRPSRVLYQQRLERLSEHLRPHSHAPGVNEEAAPDLTPLRFVPRSSDDTHNLVHPRDGLAKVLERLGRLEEQGSNTVQCLSRVEENLGHIMRIVGGVAPAAQPSSSALRESGSRAEEEGKVVGGRPQALECVVPHARVIAMQRRADDPSISEARRLEGASAPNVLTDQTTSLHEQALALVAPSEESGPMIQRGGEDRISSSNEATHHARAPTKPSSAPSEGHPKGPRPLPPTPARASAFLLHQSSTSSSGSMLDSSHILQPPRNINDVVGRNKWDPTSGIQRPFEGSGPEVVGHGVSHASVHPEGAHQDNASVAGDPTAVNSSESMASCEPLTAHEDDKHDQSFFPFRLIAHENNGALFILLEDVAAPVVNAPSTTAGTLVDNELKLTIALSEVIAMSEKARAHAMHPSDHTRPMMRLSSRTRSRLPSDTICLALATAGELQVMRSIVLDMPVEVMIPSAATDQIAGPVGSTASVDLFSECVSYFGAAENARAAEETRLHGAQIAIQNAWCRDYFFPAAARVQHWIDNSEVDEAHAAIALAYSRNWITFEAHLRDTSSSIDANALADRNIILAPLGLFWEKFYALYESCEDRSIDESPFRIKELDPALLWRLHEWFEDRNLQFQSMDDMFTKRSSDESQGTSPADQNDETDRERCWNIFLASLARSLASDTDGRLKVVRTSSDAMDCLYH
ncbi:hypothetical protein K523DRAFT_375939, partial [Schizophyllum commune Tattone D]